MTEINAACIKAASFDELSAAFKSLTAAKNEVWARITIATKLACERWDDDHDSFSFWNLSEPARNALVNMALEELRDLEDQ